MSDRDAKPGNVPLTQPGFHTTETALLEPGVRSRWESKLRVEPSGCVVYADAGRFHVSGRLPQAEPRRVAWFYEHGEWITDKRKLLIVTCKNKACVNVAHVIVSTDENRFWSQVDKNGPIIRADLGQCWVWTGLCSVKKDGPYGKFNVADPSAPLRSRNRLARHHIPAHRFSWELHNGPIATSDLFVCHKCDHPPCVNPAHLFLGTAKDNRDDCAAKGRVSRGEKHREALSRAKAERGEWRGRSAS